MEINVFYELITSFVLSGGIGYINFFLLSRMGVVNTNENDNDEKRFFLVSFSIINVLIYKSVSLISYWENIYIDIFITSLISVLLSFLVWPYLIKKAKEFINSIRIRKVLNSVNSETVKQIVLGTGKPMYFYMYDLRTDKLLVQGFLKAFDYEKPSDFEFAISPTSSKAFLTYEEILDIASSKKNVDESSIFVNTSKNVKIVLIPYK